MNRPSMILIRRAVTGVIRRPSATITGFAMSMFFLVIYNAGLGGIGFLPQFSNGGYLAFILPFCVISLGIGSSGGAGQSILRDMSSGYFHRLRLSPGPGWAFIAAPIAADAFALTITSSLFLGAGLIFGVPLTHGIISFAGIILMSVMWGITISALSAALIIRSGNPQASQGIIMIFFSAMFLSTSFLPYELITSVWLKKVLWFNPVTYPLEGMRQLICGSFRGYFVSAGIAVTAAMALLSILFASYTARKAFEY